MTFKDRFVHNYIARVPLALALERSYECLILSQQRFERPILDIGCGDGIFASVLFNEPIDTGIDPHQQDLQHAERSGMYKELLCIGAQTIPKPDGTYKTIFANSVIEHILPAGEVLQEARRVLADDGRMYLTLPTDLFDHFSVSYQLLSGLGLHAAAERLRLSFNRFWKHYHCYNEAGWRDLFEKTGWRVVQSREYGPKFNCVLNHSLVPLSIVSFVSRRILNRWFISSTFRKLYAPALAFVFSPLISRSLPVKEKCGLIFFELRKK
jgi:SAM-dependent methyltransferase